MTSEQLDMFSSPEFAHLNTNVEKYKTSADSVRRGVFARLGELKKEIDPRISKLETEMAMMKAMFEKHFGKEESNIIELQEACM